MRRVFASLALGALAGCGAVDCQASNAFALAPGEPTGPLMRPGNNCLRCHAAGGAAAAKPFSFGGTVFSSADAAACDGVAGVTLRVTDSNGKTATAVSNAAGNFWSVEPLVPPLSMEAERDGRVAKMHLRRKELESSPLANCLRKQFDTWRYPRYEGEAQHVEQRFTVSAQRGR